MGYTINDNTPNVLNAIKQAKARALERFGMQGESYAKEHITQNKSVDTGNLRNSISHRVDTEKDRAVIGTSVDYAPYVELGTGVYAEGGRPTSWVYQDDNGNWHHTKGQKAKPYLKPAVANHTETYVNIAKDEFKNG